MACIYCPPTFTYLTNKPHQLLPEPEPSFWTLRFKNHRTTILLYSQPDTSFRAIRQELLTMLKTTNPSGDLHGALIPSEADDVVLGIPKDAKDLQAGWNELEIPEQQLEESGPAASGGRNKRKLGGEQSTLDCPRGVGLKDGAVLAFKFRSASHRDDHDGEDHVMNGMSEDWDVVLPSYDDDYGVGALNAAFNPENGGETGRRGN